MDPKEFAGGHPRSPVIERFRALLVLLIVAIDPQIGLGATPHRSELGQADANAHSPRASPPNTRYLSWTYAVARGSTSERYARYFC